MRYSPRQPTLGRYGQVRIDTREPPRCRCDPVSRAACVGLVFRADDGVRLTQSVQAGAAGQSGGPVQPSQASQAGAAGSQALDLG